MNSLIKIKRKLFPYGTGVSIKYKSSYLILNGKIVTIFKGANTEKWRFRIWSNWWRKNKTSLVKEK